MIFDLFVDTSRKGISMALLQADNPPDTAPLYLENVDEAAETGAILVADDVLDLPIEGGVAAAAGKATAIVADKARKGAEKAKTSASEQAKRAKPTVQKVTKATSEAVDAGTFAVGKQLGKASGMFAAFKEEFDKASKGEE